MSLFYRGDIVADRQDAELRLGLLVAHVDHVVAARRVDHDLFLFFCHRILRFPARIAARRYTHYYNRNIARGVHIVKIPTAAARPNGHILHKKPLQISSKFVTKTDTSGIYLCRAF